MGSGGPIAVPPADKMQIAADGTISILPLGAEKGAEMQVIDKLKLVSPAGSDTPKGLDNLLHVNGGGTLPDDRKRTRLELQTLMSRSYDDIGLKKKINRYQYQGSAGNNTYNP